MKILKTAILAIAVMATAASSTVLAAPDTCPQGVNGSTSAVCSELKSGGTGFSDTTKNIVNTLLLGIGIVAVIMIIVSAIRFSISHGDQAKVANARSTLIYSVVGLVIAVLAYAIVRFVLDRL